jgi:hypothetical protein
VAENIGGRRASRQDSGAFVCSSALTVQVVQTLKRSCVLLLGRVVVLEKRVQDGDESAWATYVESVTTLSTLLPHRQPGAGGELLTTKQMAERLGISTKPLLKKRKNGGPRPAVTLVSAVAPRCALE